MSKRTELLRQVRRVQEAESRLSVELQVLSSVASDIYGDELYADLCSGSEIEFRRNGGDGYVDSTDCIRLEYILALLNND